MTQINMGKYNYKRWFFILLFIATLASISLSYYSYLLKQKVVETEIKYENSVDTVTYYKTQKGASGAIKKVYITTKEEMLNSLNSMKQTDPDFYKTLVKTPTIKTYTEFETITKLDTIVRSDTVYVTKDSTGKIDFNLKKRILEPHGYYKAKIRVHNDSVRLKVQMFDKFKIATEEKPNGFFKPKSYVVRVENTNPYVHLDSLKSFEIKPKNRVKKGIKVGAVLGVAAGLFFLLKK